MLIWSPLHVLKPPYQYGPYPATGLHFFSSKTKSPATGSLLDAIIFGHYAEGELLYAGRTRNGFTPMLRDQLQKRLRDLEVSDCPFANLPEKRSGRWGLGLTAEKMKDCRWLKPKLVGQIE